MRSAKYLSFAADCWLTSDGMFLARNLSSSCTERGAALVDTTVGAATALTLTGACLKAKVRLEQLDVPLPADMGASARIQAEWQGR